MPTAVSLHQRASIMLLTLCPNRKALRIWAAQCVLVHIRVINPDSLMARAYGQHEISERHRHRYEFNNDFREEIENAGMKMHRYFA